jgi:hypothetical protein
MADKLTAEQFLNNNGIELQKTQLLSFIDGCMRSPNLCALMEQYHEAKLKEMDVCLGSNVDDLRFIIE